MKKPLLNQKESGRRRARGLTTLRVLMLLMALLLIPLGAWAEDNSNPTIVTQFTGVAYNADDGSYTLTTADGLNNWEVVSVSTGTELLTYSAGTGIKLTNNTEGVVPSVTLRSKFKVWGAIFYNASSETDLMAWANPSDYTTEQSADVSISLGETVSANARGAYDYRSNPISTFSGAGNNQDVEQLVMITDEYVTITIGPQDNAGVDETEFYLGKIYLYNLYTTSYVHSDFNGVDTSSGAYVCTADESGRNWTSNKAVGYDGPSGQGIRFVEWNDDTSDWVPTSGTVVLTSNFTCNGTLEAVKLFGDFHYGATVSVTKLEVADESGSFTEVEYSQTEYENYSVVTLTPTEAITIRNGRLRVTLSVTGTPSNYNVSLRDIVVYAPYGAEADPVAPASSYGLTVAGIEVTSENASNITGGQTNEGTPQVAFDAATHTLTLTEASVALNDSIPFVESSLDLLTVKLNSYSYISYNNDEAIAFRSTNPAAVLTFATDDIEEGVLAINTSSSKEAFDGFNAVKFEDGLAYQPNGDSKMISKVYAPQMFSSMTREGEQTFGFESGETVHYAIDYVDESLEDVADAVYDMETGGPALAGPCIVTAWSQVDSVRSETVVGKYFGVRDTTVLMNSAPYVPAIIPAVGEDEIYYNFQLVETETEGAAYIGQNNDVNFRTDSTGVVNFMAYISEGDKEKDYVVLNGGDWPVTFTVTVIEPKKPFYYYSLDSNLEQVLTGLTGYQSPESGSLPEWYRDEDFTGTITFTSSDPDVASIDEEGNITVVTYGGQTTISATSEAVGLYAAGNTSFQLTTMKRTMTLYVPDDVTAKMGETFTLPSYTSATDAVDAGTDGLTVLTGREMASSVAGMPLTWSIVVDGTAQEQTIATISDNVLTPLHAGTVTLQVYYAGDAETAEASRTLTMTIEKGTPVLAWSANTATVKLGAQEWDEPELTNELEVDVVLQSSNQSVATIVDNQLQILAPGETTITASFEGDDDYEAAEPVSYTLTVTATTIACNQQWTTYCAEEDLAVPEGLEAYIVTSVSGSEVTVQAISYIPQGVGVLLERTNDKVSSFMAAVWTGEETTFSTNLLHGAEESTDVTALSGTVYVLYNGVFVKTISGSVPAHKAYLVLGAVQAVDQNPKGDQMPEVGGIAEGGAGAPQRLYIRRIGTTTGIAATSRVATGNGEEVYDLMGRKMANGTLPAGLYIVNGKKIMIK